MSDIKFGTDGWRAVLGKDFTYENTDKVVNAIAIYIYNESKFNRKLLVGYDPRYKADEFASYIAEKFASFGFDVELSSKIIATPVLAYSALKNDAYSIMLTASHNPPEYLGIKFIPPYGGPAEDYMTKEIVKNLDTLFVSENKKAYVNNVSFEKEYIEHIEKIINFEIIRQSDITVNYDGHHGAAAFIFKKILDKHEIKNNCQNMDRDINFGGQMPDPKEKYLLNLKNLCIKSGTIGLSNDGDGDRFGVFDEKGNFIFANDIIAMLLKHLKERKGYNGKLAKTTGSSAMLDIFAKKLGVDVIETPVGFKWLGKAMREDDVIIAGEESGGLSIKGHIPEKDGILANLLIMEMIAYSNKTLFELHEEFLTQFGRKFLNSRIDLKLSNSQEQETVINKFKTYKNIGNYKIINSNTLDGLKLYLEDGSWLLIRKSGTEPLLRIYYESDKEEKMQELKNSIKQLC